MNKKNILLAGQMIVASFFSSLWLLLLRINVEDALFPIIVGAVIISFLGIIVYKLERLEEYFEENSEDREEEGTNDIGLS